MYVCEEGIYASIFTKKLEINCYPYECYWVFLKKEIKIPKRSINQILLHFI